MLKKGDLVAAQTEFEALQHTSLSDAHLAKVTEKLAEIQRRQTVHGGPTLASGVDVDSVAVDVDASGCCLCGTGRAATRPPPTLHPHPPNEVGGSVSLT